MARVKYFLFFLIVSVYLTGCSTTLQIEEKLPYVPEGVKLDTVKAGRFDTGKMWTFEYPPIDYFKEEYNFAPSKDWLDHARLSALRFSTYCSASFISADGLVMTNDHCGRESATDVTGKGEEINDDGFYAPTLKDERKVDGLFVDQLVLIKDVTDEVRNEIDKASSYENKNRREDDVIKEIKEREEKNTGYIVEITSLYNGGKYSLYGYKRYDDVRLVFIPESQLGYFGGDYDNFTYPRFNLDCSFFRVYENDKPLETKNYLKWNNEGAKDGEAVFAVGNPGSSNRLNTIAQLEYARDYQYPQMVEFYSNMVQVFTHLIEIKPEKKDELTDELLKYSNSLKAVKGYLKGLQDPILMQKKRVFENTFRAAVNKDEKLKKIYGNIWDEIASIRKKMSGVSKELDIYLLNPLSSSEYFLIAQEILNIADQLNLPETERSEDYKGEMLDSTILNLVPPDFDKEKNRGQLIEQIRNIYSISGRNNEYVKYLTDGKDPEQAADYILSRSILTDETKIKDLIKEGTDAVYNSDDPFITYILKTEKRQRALQRELNEMMSEEAIYNNQLGRALYDIYGTSIPPDATFTLRISDGVVKGYHYNGTIAPAFTTFNGLYDRFYSFNEKSPWDLPDRWLNPPADFDLSVPFDFCATNDIIGGNSGSPVINIKGEAVGLAFDGNMESLPGDFIYNPENNRMICVHPKAITESLKKIYNAGRLAKEIIDGKID
ncbi:MAG: S46 family peptidase [Ignavibacteriaceae bacterium]|nr:S46 family peptidase [Ignavibacteriaceae bacterium]